MQHTSQHIASLHTSHIRAAPSAGNKKQSTTANKKITTNSYTTAVSNTENECKTCNNTNVALTTPTRWLALIACASDDDTHVHTYLTVHMRGRAL